MRGVILLTLAGLLTGCSSTVYLILNGSHTPGSDLMSGVGKQLVVIWSNHAGAEHELTELLIVAQHITRRVSWAVCV